LSSGNLALKAKLRVLALLIEVVILEADALTKPADTPGRRYVSFFVPYATRPRLYAPV
jgi:hypothetical protein